MALDTTIGGASSDSYGTLAEFAFYAVAMGWTLTGDAAAQEANLRRAAMFLDRQYQWVGRRASDTQALAWPRQVTVLTSDGFAIPSDSIPRSIIDAQFELAYLENQGTDLLSFQDGGALKRERIKAGAVEIDSEYSDQSNSSARIVSIEGLLRDYVTGSQPGAGSEFVRIARG